MKDQDLNGQFLLALGCSNEMRFSMGFIWEKSSSFLERCGRTVIWNFWLTIPRGFLHSHFQAYIHFWKYCAIIGVARALQKSKNSRFCMGKTVRQVGPCVTWCATVTQKSVPIPIYPAPLHHTFHHCFYYCDLCF
jgi:hypothetical protein